MKDAPRPSQRGCEAGCEAGRLAGQVSRPKKAAAGSALALVLAFAAQGLAFATGGVTGFAADVDAAQPPTPPTPLTRIATKKSFFMNGIQTLETLLPPYHGAGSVVNVAAPSSSGGLRQPSRNDAENAP